MEIKASRLLKIYVHAHAHGFFDFVACMYTAAIATENQYVNDNCG